MNEECITELIELIAVERDRVAATFPFERRLGLIELTRAIDDFFLRQVLPTAGPGDDRDALFRCWVYGWGTALDLFLDDSCQRPGSPLVPSDEEMRRWAGSVLQHCGKVGLCRQLLHLHRSGLLELRKVGHREYAFRSAEGRAGVEWFDGGDFDWASGRVAALDAPLRDRLATRQEQINRVMAGLVRPWETHYIAYDADPEVDDHYVQAGILQSRRMHGQDAFPPEATFGGVPFERYVSAAAILVGWTLKHVQLCSILLERERTRHPRNLITIPCRADELRESMAAAMVVDEAVAGRCLAALWLDLPGKGAHCATPGGAPPPLIQFGDGRALHSVYGSLDRPFWFLLNELRRTYRPDWDRAVNLREQAFRTDLFALFPQPHLVKIDRGVKIKRTGSVVTDIDAIILDRRTGTAGLFQLKWQDAFGNSMAERASKKANLLDGGNMWVDRTTAWLQDNGLAESARALGLAGYGVELKDIRLFVIARNAAHFSGDGNPHPEAAWGMWLQVLRLCSEGCGGHSPIERLFDALRDDCPFRKSLPEVETEEIRIGETLVRVEPPVPGAA
jgi:hypothetical protein